MVLRFARPRARNGLLYRIQFTKTIAFCPRCCCRKQTEQSVHNRSFNLRCYKFVILGGRRAVFFSEAKLKFRHEALIAVTNLQVRFIVAHKSEGGVYILRVGRENRFTFDRTVLWTKTIWFQKYYTENVLKLLLVHTFFFTLVCTKSGQLIPNQIWEFCNNYD